MYLQILLDTIKWLWAHRKELTLLGVLGFLIRELSKQIVQKQINKALHHLFGNDDLQRIESKIDALLVKEGIDWNADTLNLIVKPSMSRGGAISMFYWAVKSTVRYARRSMILTLRRIPMLKLLTTSAGRKIIYFLLASAVTYLNNRFGLNLNADSLFGVWGAALTLMQLEAHFNLKQFISGAVNALSGAAQTATTSTTGQPITTVTTPPMTQQEATAILNELTKELQPIYESVKSGRDSQAVQQGFQLAAQALALIKQNKGA